MVKQDDKTDRGKEHLGVCPVCGRKMVAGPSVDRHHWQPKSRGGREAQPLHLICHQKLHSLFSTLELSTTYAHPEAVQQHPQMQVFISWVRRRPSEFIDRHKKPRASKINSRPRTRKM